MAAPWDRITDDTYKSWLLDDMTATEYNGLGPVERRTLHTQFQQQQQHQQQTKGFASAVRKLTGSATPYPLEVLPINNNDDLWKEIRSLYGLSLSECVALKNWQQEKRNNDGTPSLRDRHNDQSQGTAPPSTGIETPKLAYPRKSPSSEEGKDEGLNHASNDNNTHMQCTSTPACVALLEILENVVKDQQNKNLDDKYQVAANHVLQARYHLKHGMLPKDVGTNERFFTGAMANAMNSVMQDGYCVLHKACLGSGATHSDLSGTHIDKGSSPTTLMVGEGKWNAIDLRGETRGQIFNEMLRHRAIDRHRAIVGQGEEGNGPILLLAFDQRMVEIDLAFPSTMGGKLSKDQVVEFFEGVEDGKETFWTVPMLRTDIADSKGKINLPIVLRFISDSLEKLDSWPLKGPRVQHKMPMPLQVNDEINAVSKYCGENMTIIEEKSGSKHVYKEYCYHLREHNSILLPKIVAIEKSDQRQPPSRELLDKLGEPYTDWEVHKGPFDTSVLRYPFIEGDSDRPSVDGWMMILNQTKTMHGIEWVHGDLLPRNVLFGIDGKGYLIDFDLSRKVGATYVRGYNYKDFNMFRHKDAREGKIMTKDHDLHSLRQMSKFFFDLGHVDVSTYDLDQLINFFHDNPELPQQP